MQRRYQDTEQQPQEMREVREKQYTRNNQRITEYDVKEVKQWKLDRQGQEQVRIETREESIRRKEYLRNRPIVHGESVNAIEERVEKLEFKLKKYQGDAPQHGNRIVRSRDEQRRQLMPPTAIERSKSRSFRTPNAESEDAVTHQTVRERISQTYVKGVENNRTFTEASISQQTREKRMETQGQIPGMRGVQGTMVTGPRERGAGRGTRVAGSLRDYLGDEAESLLQPMREPAPERLEDEADMFDEVDEYDPFDAEHRIVSEDMEELEDQGTNEYQRRMQLKKKYLERRKLIAERGGPAPKRPMRSTRARTDRGKEHETGTAADEETSVDSIMAGAKALSLDEGSEWSLDVDAVTDRTFRAMISELEVTPEQQRSIDLANRRRFFEQNLHRDDILDPEQLFLRDFGPDTIVNKILSPLQRSTVAIMEEKLNSKEITSEELQLMRSALPGIFARTSHSSARDVIDDLVDPDNAQNEYTKIISGLKNEDGAFANIEDMEKLKLIQLRKLDEQGRLTDDVLDAYEQKMPADEFLEMVRLEGFAHALHNPDFNMNAFVESQKLRGYAARKIRAERNGDTEVAPLYTKEEWDSAMEKKEIDVIRSMTAKGFALLSGIKPLDQRTADFVPHLPAEVNNAIQNRVQELKTLARNRESEILKQRDRILESHAAVKHARLMHAIGKFQDEYVGHKIPSPYIEDVISSSTAAKLGRNQFLMPFDRNFADLIEATPEGSVARFRLVQHIRALSRNDDLSIKEIRYMAGVLLNQYTKQKLTTIKEEAALDPRIAIRPGRYTHLHPRRQSLFVERYKDWLMTSYGPTDTAGEEDMDTGFDDEFD